MKPIRWKKHEKQLLYDKLVEERLPLENIVIPGRKPYFIRRQALKMGLIPRLRNPDLTEAQKIKLCQLKKQRFTAKQISDFDLLGPPHRTANAIRKKLGKMELVDENRSRARRSRKVWRDGEKQEFDDFLLKNSGKLATEQIAKKFGVKTATVNVGQRRLGIKISFAEILAIPHVREKRGKADQQRVKKMLLAFEEHIARRERKLQALARKLRRQKRVVPLEEKVCKICGKRWLKHPRFFFHEAHRTSMGFSWYFSRACTICEAKQHHQKNVAAYQRKYSQRLE